jgi:hypothetical protein
MNGRSLAEELRTTGAFPPTMQCSTRVPVLGNVSWVAPVVHVDVVDAERRVRAVWLTAHELLDDG